MIGRISFLFLLILVCAVCALAQCPRVKVSSPDDVDSGQPITFTVSVTGGDQDVTPTFNWTVSDGTISSGQGTSTITVDTTGIDGGDSTATVKIGGYSRRCNTAASSTTSIKPKPQPAQLFDKFGALAAADRNVRLDNFAIQLQNDPMAEGYIIGYAGRKSLTGAAAKSVAAARTYLLNVRGIDSSRVTTLDGGYRETPTTELWYVPRGAAPPQASPTLDRSEIKAPTTKPTTKPSAAKRPK